MPNAHVPAAAEGMPRPLPTLTGATENPSPFPGFEVAFESLETPIQRLVGFANALDVLHTDSLPCEGDMMIYEHRAKALMFVAEEIRLAANALDALWTEFWNASPDTSLGRPATQNGHGAASAGTGAKR